MNDVAELHSDERTRQTILKALRQSKGRVTVGDVVASTGLDRDTAEAAMKDLLKTHEGHLEVSEDGDLVYLFDPKLVLRDALSGWQKFKDKAYAGFKAGFKVWIMLMLVVYFVIYVTLAIAAFVAITSQNRDSNRSSFRSNRSGGFSIYWLLYLFWTPNHHYGRRSHYYGDTSHYRMSGRRGSSAPKVPFYKKVFAFVFGPDEPEVDPNDRDRAIAKLARARRGALTSAELVEFTGESLADADSEMGRLMGAFNGDAHITDDGEVVYTFQELMLSAEGKVAERDIPPAWNKLEVPLKVTGNTGKVNAIIGSFNGFNLFFGFISPAVIFPILGIYGTTAMVGLVYIPLVFSLMFFGIPIVRRFTVAKENTRRHSRNVRKLVLRSVFESARRGDGVVQADAVITDVTRSVDQVKTTGSPLAISQAIRSTAAEFDADVEIDEAARERYAFPTVQRALRSARDVRKKLRLDKQEVGEIIFSSADDEQQAAEREMKEFDKLLAEDAEESEESEEAMVH